MADKAHGSQKSRCKTVGHDHDNQYQPRNNKGDGLTEEGRSSSGGPVETNGNQTQANKGDHRGSDQGRKETPDTPDKGADQKLHDPSDDEGTKDGLDPKGVSYGDHGRDEYESRPHADRESGPQDPYTTGLKNGTDSGGDENPLNQNRFLRSREINGALTRKTLYPRERLTSPFSVPFCRSVSPFERQLPWEAS